MHLNVAQLGRVLGSGPRGREFKSLRSDHEKDTPSMMAFSFIPVL